MEVQNYLFVYVDLQWPACVFSGTVEQRHFPSVLENGSLYSGEKFPTATSKQSIKLVLWPDCHREGA